MTEGTESDVDRQARRRRHRHAAVLVAVVVALACVFGYVLTYNRNLSERPTAAPSPTCTPTVQPVATVAPDLVHVRVINATDRGGLADTVANRLEKRHFHVISVGNYHGDTPVSGVAEVHFGAIGRKIAQTVAHEVQGHVKMVKDDRVDPSVDLVLGPKYSDLVKLPPAKPGTFTVNVYNTTYHPGWASDVAGELKKRGFKVGKVGNYAAMPKAPVEIHYGINGDPAARRVALQFKGAQLIRDGRTSTTVDLLIGNDYTTMVPKAQATAKPTPTPSTTQQCRTSGARPSGTPSAGRG
ncbi:MAG TPA: LytR C-terminal domain-containing protein [Segeticoccus sp.]|uniref:LytR C-terminal domain-containing protein n=1 Tax=Segeticoccus sp. TaxID=2706531 RepID=UPI002D801E83|nr:LytR C-terminal domain-containing protein [Segeticoccus sp.]HET8598765.1 LytR C-terminal domain-containing protein [Segeticoccus sp.]